jgi:hypothetical protein
LRVFIIDTSNMGPELRGGMIGVVGSGTPTAEEKRDCIEAVSRYAANGWAIAADPQTSIGRLAAFTAEAACAPFMAFSRIRSLGRSGTVLAIVKREERDLRR